MTDSWETGVLGNYVSLRSGGTPSKARADFWSGTNPWISAKDMKSYWIDGTEDTLSSLGAEHATRIVPAGTTLILVRGMTLHKEIPICRTRQPSAFNQDVKAVIPINGLDNDFLPYLLLGNKAKIRNIVDSAGHGTGRIDSNALLNMQVQVPPPEEQCRIAQILGTLDDKIDLNRHMNQTLESIARALFKSWFVDFDPVRAKAEGRDTGLPKYIADVFPDRLIHCKRGDIPEGWRYDDASSVATIGIGKTPPRKEPEWFLDGSSGVPWISIRDMGTANTFIRETSESLSDSAITKFNIRRVPPGAVLLSFKLTIGRVAISACELVTNEAIAHFVLPSGSTLSKEFLYLYLSQFDYSELGSTSSIATAVNSTTIRHMPILIPPDSAISAFNNSVAAIFSELSRRQQENRTLTQIRNTLLPMFIPGQLSEIRPRPELAEIAQPA